MEQSKIRGLQCRDLNAPGTTIGKLAHQHRMLSFPVRPHVRAFENAARDQLLVVIGTHQRRLYAISGDAHEPRVTDGMAEHSSLLNPRFLVNAKGSQPLPSADNTSTAHAFTSLASNRLT